MSAYHICTLLTITHSTLMRAPYYFAVMTGDTTGAAIMIGVADSLIISATYMMVTRVFHSSTTMACSVLIRYPELNKFLVIDLEMLPGYLGEIIRCKLT